MAEMASPAGKSPGMGRVLKDSSYYLIGSIASRAIGFVFIPFYAHHLSPAEYGLVELIELSTQTIAIALGLQAIGLALTRLFYDQKTAETQAAVTSTAIIATAVLSGLVTLLAMGAAVPISNVVFHTPEWASLLRAAFAAMFLSNMAEVVLVYERIRNRAFFFLVFTTVSLLGSVCLNVLFLGPLGMGVWGFVASKLVVSTVGAVFLLARARVEVGWRWVPAYVPGFLRLGFPLVISGLAFFVFHFSDRFFLTGWVSLADLGRYSLAYKMAMLVSVITGDAFGKAWEATLFRYTEQAGWQARFASVAAYLTIALFATGLGVALFTPSLVAIMAPPDYQPPPLVIPIVVLSYIAREIGDFYRMLLLVNKRATTVSRISVAGAIVNIGTNMLLIPFLGVMGAAYATLATWLFYMVVSWVVANREHGLPVRPLAYVWITVLSVPFYVAGTRFDTGNIFLQFLADGVVVLAFCAACGATFLSRGERQQASQFIGPMVIWARGRLLPSGRA